MGVFFHFGKKFEIHLFSACRLPPGVFYNPIAVGAAKKSRQQFLSSFEYRRSYFFSFHPIYSQHHVAILYPVGEYSVCNVPRSNFLCSTYHFSFSLNTYISFLQGQKKKTVCAAVTLLRDSVSTKPDLYFNNIVVSYQHNPPTESKLNVLPVLFQHGAATFACITYYSWFYMNVVTAIP